MPEQRALYVTSALRSIIIDRASVAQLRKAAATLQEICSILEKKETGPDDPDALPITWIGDVQPLCVFGARYVRRTTGVVPYFDSEADVASADEYTASRPSEWAHNVRLRALQLLARIFITFPKEFLMRWKMVMDFAPYMLDDHKSPTVPLLMGICRSDTSSKVRSAASMAVCALMSSPQLRSFPVALEDLAPPGLSEKTAKFNTMTGTISQYIRLAHVVFGNLLRKESAHALHSLAELASSVPYHHLRPGILSHVTHLLEPFFRVMRANAIEGTQDATSQAVVNLLVSIFSREKVLVELVPFAARLFDVLHGCSLQKIPFVVDFLACLTRVAQLYPQAVGQSYFDVALGILGLPELRNRGIKMLEFADIDNLPREKYCKLIDALLNEPNAIGLVQICRAARSPGAWNYYGERIMSALEKCIHVPALAHAARVDDRAVRILLELAPNNANALVALSEIAKNDPSGSQWWCRDALSWLPTTNIEGKQGIVYRALGYFAALEPLPAVRAALRVLIETTMTACKTQWNAYAAMGHLISNPYITVDECNMCLPALVEGLLSNNNKVRAIAARSCARVLLRKLYL